MLRFVVFVALVFPVSASLPSVAAAIGAKEGVVATVKRIQGTFRKDAPEAIFIALKNKDQKFNDRDLYPFIHRLDGMNVAHGAGPALVGKHLLNLKGPDGVQLICQMIEIANEQGSSWIDCKRSNSTANATEDKTSYFEKMGNYLVGVGVYRP
jgi:cytochrome c